jgi:glycosyltransferase involved in cell wall biosynthesis
MRLLILTWLYEPHATPRALRWKSVAHEFAALGHTVDIVTAREPGMPDFSSARGIDIHRCGGTLFTSVKSFAKPGHGPSTHNFLKRSAASLTRRVYQATWRKLYWPDKACLWIRPAIRTACHLLSQHRYDGLITVSLPFSAHLAGYAIKKRYPELRWLADTGDPFALQDDSPPNNVRLYRALNRRWEQKILRAADEIAVTNDSMRQVYSRLFPEAAGKLSIVPPVLSPDVPRHLPLALASRRKKLLFLGTLYRAIRHPAYLLALFDSIQRASPDTYELHFVGDLGDCLDAFTPYAAQMENSIFLHGSQPRDKAMAALTACDFVVNIGNTTAYQLPSKLVEYAAARKLILNLANCDQDSSSLFLQEYPAALSVRQTPRPEADDVRRVLHFLETPPSCDPVPLEAWLNRFRPRSIALSYLRGFAAQDALKEVA